MQPIKRRQWMEQSRDTLDTRLGWFWTVGGDKQLTWSDASVLQ